MKGQTSHTSSKSRKYGKITPPTDTKGRSRVADTKDHSPKVEEPRGPNIKGLIIRRRILRRAWEIWAFLRCKGGILLERKVWPEYRHKG